MDVFTNFGNNFTPIQADKLERGPVRLRSALQFSLNVPAIKGTLITGLDHVFDRTKEFGLEYEPTRVPVTSMGIGTLEVHPISLLGAYGMVANGGRLMPRTMITKVVDEDGKTDLSAHRQEAGRQAGREQAGGLHRHGHPGGQHRHEGQPVLGRTRHLRRRPTPARRPTRRARRATTRTSPPTATWPHRRTRSSRRSPSASGWATATATPNDGKLSLDTSAPLWDAILTDISRGTPIATLQAAGRPADARPWTRSPASSPDRSPPRRSRSCSSRAPSRPSARRSRVAKAIDEASGLLWQEGCVGPKVTEGFFNMAEVEAGHPDLAEGRPQLGQPRRPGHRCPRRLEGHQDRVLLRQRVLSRSGGAGAPSSPRPSSVRWHPRRRRRCDPLLLPPEATPCPSVEPEPERREPEPVEVTEALTAGPARPARGSQLDDRRSVPAFAALTRPHRRHERVRARPDGGRRRAAPRSPARG